MLEWSSLYVVLHGFTEAQLSPQARVSWFREYLQAHWGFPEKGLNPAQLALISEYRRYIDSPAKCYTAYNRICSALMAVYGKEDVKIDLLYYTRYLQTTEALRAWGVIDDERWTII